MFHANSVCDLSSEPLCSLFISRRTPLHCAASCNSVHLCKMLVESGAAIFATTISDVETAADKCEEMEEGYTQCSQFLYGRFYTDTQHGFTPKRRILYHDGRFFL